MKQKLVSIVASVLSALTVTTMPFAASAAENPADYTIKDYTTAEGFYNRVTLSKTWQQSEDRVERGEMLQLPQYMLDRMTTDALVEAVLDYPFFYDVYAFDDVQVGFDLMMDTFNGVQELADRDDVASVLLDKYCDEDVMMEADSADADSEMFRLTNMEILMSQDFVTTKFTKKEKNKFVKSVASKMEDKLASEVCGDFTNNLLFDLAEKNFNDGGLLKNVQDVKDGYGPGYVTTPKGTKVGTTYHDSEPLTQSQIMVINALCARDYPNATKLRDASGKYNCHSYAWYSQSTSNSHWMNNPALYVSDGSYVSASKLSSGLKLVYVAKNSPDYPDGFPIHSAILYSYSNNAIQKVTSKWGQCGLYRHSVTNCPYSYFDLYGFKRA